HIFQDLQHGIILLRLQKSINNLTPDELYQQYSRPDGELIKRLDGKKLIGDNVPTHAIVPISLGKPSEDATLEEAYIYLNDFGESFVPSLSSRYYCSVPIHLRPP